MKIRQSLKSLIGALALSSMTAYAKGGPDPAKFAAAIAACESSSYNTNQITLPTPTAGERPEFTEAQHQLLEACETAGILPPHPHHGDHRGPAPAASEAAAL